MLYVYVDPAPAQTQVAPFLFFFLPALISATFARCLHAADNVIVSPSQVDSLQTAVFFDGNGVFAPLLHHVCHLALRAWAAPEMCQ